MQYAIEPNAGSPQIANNETDIEARTLILSETIKCSQLCEIQPRGVNSGENYQATVTFLCIRVLVVAQ